VPSWRGWGCRKICGSGARGFYGRPRWCVRTSRSGSSSLPEKEFDEHAIRTAASVRQPLNAALLIAIEDLVAGLAGNAELPAESSVIAPPASRRATNCRRSSITETLLPRHHFLLKKKGKVEPMCPVRSVTYISQVAQTPSLGSLGDVPIELRKPMCRRRRRQETFLLPRRRGRIARQLGQTAYHLPR
jgi:hypothetical protein